MPTTLITMWAATGVLSGAAVQTWTRRLLSADHTGVLTTRLMAPLLTAILFGSLAWRLGWNIDLLAYSYLAAIGVALAIIDTLDHRLPSKMVLPSLAVLAGLFTTSAIVNADGASLLRAVTASIAVAGFYLVLALASGGGLGAGDVKLGGLIGLTLGWSSWSALITATFLGWCLAAWAWLLLRVTRRKLQGSSLPLGPFLLAGALLTINVMPT